MSALPTKVQTITPHLHDLQCPAELRDLPAWLCWRFESVGSEKKPRKVPFYAGGGKRYGVQGRPEDRERLVTFEAAKSAAIRRGMDGVGMALLEGNDVVALDFDRCVGPAGIDPEVERVIRNTYSEFSPSGTGIRAFMRGRLPNAKDQTGPFGFEVFSTSGFVTFTGNTTQFTAFKGLENTIVQVTDEVRSLCAARFGAYQRADSDPLMDYAPVLGLTAAQIDECLDVLDPDVTHDVWLRVGMALHHESEGAAFETWDAWSKKGKKYAGRDDLLTRWESFSRATGQLVTARSLIKLAHQAGAHINPAIGTPEEFAVAVQASTQATPAKFQVVEADAFATQASQRWLIKGVVPRADLVVLFGASGSGKSFVCIDLAAHICQGKAWRGHRVTKGRVVYVAAEGGSGFRKRLRAYSKHHNLSLEGLGLGVVHAAPNLLEKQDSVELVRSIMAWGPTDLVVIDTFAQVMPGGNENLGEDVGRALAHCRRIAEATGATVLLVHHSGKDSSKGARGWSGLRAAADAEIEVVRSDDTRSMQLTKSKDSIDSVVWGFSLEVVPVGVDEDGDVIDSCVVVEAEAPTLPGPSRKVGQTERLALEVFNELVGESDSVDLEQLIDAIVQRRPPPAEGQRDQRRSNTRRDLAAMTPSKEYPIWVEGGRVWRA